MRGISYLAVGVSILSIISAGSVGAATETMTLLQPDRPAPIIVIGAEPAASERYAAEEMSTYLEKMTSRKIEVVDDNYELAPRFNHGKLIAIGNSKLTDSTDTTGLGVEQYVIDVQPNMIAIVGGSRPALPGQPARDAGTLYGVYDFLEGLGVRWYRPERWGEHVPTMAEISLEIGKRVSPEPSYAFRAAMGGGMSYWREETWEESMQACTWAARNRVNGGFSTRSRWPGQVAKYGGMEEHGVGNHNWPVFIPASEYYESHPEYFALIDGKRDRFDLCPGNPDLQRVFADKLIASAEKNPYLSSYSVEPADARGGACECDLCKALDEPKNTRPHGQWSNRVAAFCNNVAGMVADKAPWLNVQWLGYSLKTSAPTNVKQLAPNTEIMLCPINGWDDMTKKLMDPSSRSNAQFVKMAREWVELKPKSLMTYLYYDGYGWPGPLPITRTVADRMRSYRKLGITGLYLPGVRSWGPYGLDYYMYHRLAWNPDLDVDEELNLYYKSYYGPAEAPMKAYHERLMKALETAKYPVRSGGRGMYIIFTPALVRELGKYMGEAQALVKGKPLYERRLHGVWAGYEFSRRISEILVLKKKTGVVSTAVPDAERMELPPDMARPEFTGTGSYLQSAEAEKAYGELVRWMRTVNNDDAVFDMKINFKDDAAEKIYPKRGDNFGSSFTTYLPIDMLLNALHNNLREEDMLKDF